jgi:hypothetical protein
LSIAGSSKPSSPRSSMNARARRASGGLAAIAEQEAIFRAEFERMDREGDYEEPKGEPSLGTVAYVGTRGRGRIIV